MTSPHLCVIPARGGSERLPGKNLLPLLGKPMIAYTIEAAHGSELFDEVYVSTDSPEIAAVAERWGAKVPTPLPEALAQADQSSMGACTFLHDHLLAAGLGRWEYLFCLQPTSPLRLSEDIREAARLAQTAAYEHVVSVTPIDPHYHHWAMRDEGGLLVPVFGPEYQVARQLLPEALRPNGAVKVMRTDLIGRHETFFASDRVGYFRMPEERSVHVAFEADLVLAEAMLLKRGAAGPTGTGRLRGKTVLVTGATGLVGGRVAKACSAEGARLIATGRSGAAAAEVARGLGSEAVGLPLDCAAPESIDEFLGELRRRDLHPDVLVHCARSVEALKAPEGNPSWENWLTEYAVDVVAPHRLAKGLESDLARSGTGCVILVSSIYGLVAVNPSLYPNPEWASPIHYGAAKAAVLQVVRDLSVQLAPRSVRVNAVTYGGVEGRANEEFHLRYRRLCPSGRMLSTEDVGEPVVFLASDGARGVSGHNLVVDGGWTTW